MHQNRQAFASQRCTGIQPTITNHNIFLYFIFWTHFSPPELNLPKILGVVYFYQLFSFSNGVVVD